MRHEWNSGCSKKKDSIMSRNSLEVETCSGVMARWLCKSFVWTREPINQFAEPCARPKVREENGVDLIIYIIAELISREFSTYSLKNLHNNLFFVATRRTPTHAFTLFAIVKSVDWVYNEFISYFSSYYSCLCDIWELELSLWSELFVRLQQCCLTGEQRTDNKVLANA